MSECWTSSSKPVALLNRGVRGDGEPEVRRREVTDAKLPRKSLKPVS